MAQKLRKKIYTAMHSRKMRHNAYLWPYVRITRGDAGQISTVRVAGQTIPTISLQEAFKGAGSTFHVILSGPSIASIDYHELSDLQLQFFGVNGSIVLQEKFGLQFPFYCLIDDDFVSGKVELVEKIVGTADRTLFLTPSVLRHLLQHVPYSHIRCQLSLIENIAERAFCPVATPATLREKQRIGLDIVLFDSLVPCGFSFEPAAGWFDAATVAYAALQVVVWGSAKQVYFHGLDITNASTQGRFYEEGEQRLATRLEEDFDEYIEPSFRHAIPLLRERGIDVFNLSPNSALDRTVIPYVDWHSLNGTRDETL